MKIETEVSIRCIVTTLMDNTSPVGETNHDHESNAKLREVSGVVASMVGDIWWIYYENSKRNEASMKEAADIAKNALLGIKEALEDLSEED